MFSEIDDVDGNVVLLELFAELDQVVRRVGDGRAYKSNDSLPLVFVFSMLESELRLQQRLAPKSRIVCQAGLTCAMLNPVDILAAPAICEPCKAVRIFPMSLLSVTRTSGLRTNLSEHILRPCKELRSSSNTPLSCHGH